MKALVVLSGGMDSVTLLHYFAASYGADAVSAVSFHYGQRHKRELISAGSQCRLLGVRHFVLTLPIEGLPGSCLTDHAVDTPHGHYAEETMRRTVVPGRNAGMLATAWGLAAAAGAHAVGTAVHAGDHHIYPDCRPDFVRALGEALALGTRGHSAEGLHLETPFLYWTKTEILRLGFALGVDYGLTWTCYEGLGLACGRCGACQERLGAFSDVRVADPLEYATRERMVQSA